MSKYLFDASSWIFCANEAYPMANFPIVWNLFLKINSQICYIDSVVRELKQKDDGLNKWIRKEIKNQCFTEIKQSDPGQILNKHYPDNYPQQKADPFLIATAKEYNLTLITQETVSGHRKSPKIPVICREEKVECLNILEFWSEIKQVFKA